MRATGPVAYGRGSIPAVPGELQLIPQIVSPISEPSRTRQARTTARRKASLVRPRPKPESFQPVAHQLRNSPVTLFKLFGLRQPSGCTATDGIAKSTFSATGAEGGGRSVVLG